MPVRLVRLSLADSAALTWSDVTDWLLGPGVKILLVIVIAVALKWMVNRLVRGLSKAAIDSRLTRFVAVGASGASGQHAQEDPQAYVERHAHRVRTTSTMVRSALTILIGAIAVVTVLDILGIPLGPLIASAGIGGVALGIGAQSLVKDYLSGVVMIMEDQYGVGDVVEAGLATGPSVVGTVEDVSLRVTRIRDANGVAWYVPNGQFVRVGNTTQGWSVAIVDTPIAYTENTETALSVIRGAVDALDHDPAWSDKLIEAPQVIGIESVGGATLTIRTTCKCLPQQNFPVQRELRERIKIALDKAGIEGPPPMPFGRP